MKCPFCGLRENRVIDSRIGANGEVTRRRRECEACKRRYTTYERVEEVLPSVVKRDGRRELFDRCKIIKGLTMACSKRPVSTEQIDAIAESIEREVQESGEREFPYTAIGEKVMDRLRGLDQVAYVRFASVYRQFRDIDDFTRELATLVTERSSR
ncbi:MAG: transcriptional regulator NrdR [Polyangiaceae bacterium]|jgi:transcriptional repressor NrdR|nr:transcriptional regulator NrdR [Polyangiaceae bacterium]